MEEGGGGSDVPGAPGFCGDWDETVARPSNTLTSTYLL